MVKQRLEKTLQQCLVDRPNIYYHKIQVNPMAHHKTPGDFLILTPCKNFIVECKECTGTNFPFSRYTQKQRLEEFADALWRNQGLILISFWKGSKKHTKYYLLEEWHLKRLIKKSTKKSVNEKDLEPWIITYDDLYSLQWLK